MNEVEKLLRAKYCPETLEQTEGATAPSSIVDIKKSALPNLFDFDNVGDWLAAIEVDMHGWPLKLRQAIIKQALQAYLKE